MSLDKRIILVSLVCLGFISGLLFLVRAPKVSAASDQQVVETPDPDQIAPEVEFTESTVSNDVCLGCHGTPGLTMTLLNGDVLDLYVNPEEYAQSIHGKDGYACVQCHTELGEYPHPPFTASDFRDATLELSNACNRCHSGQYTLTMDSVHYDKQAKGIKTAAVCSDCHGAHNVRQWTDPETNILLPEAKLEIPTTCAKCHYEIYQKYESSVHGAALTEESNTDVPTCIDCHGVHNIGNPTTAAFRLKSPQLCASCHTSPELMDKYGISTDVLNTYVSDFHGTTVTLFEKQSPDAQTNKPVCYDCHGVHDISRVNDPETGLEMQENLLVRCQECHPDATANFPSSWMSHYIPSSDTYALVYYVNLFYKIFIPLVLGGMLAMVGLDFGHNVYVKARKKGRSAPIPSTPVDSSTPSDNPVPPPTTEQTTEEVHHD
jgi:hypothetical protein